MPYTQTHSLVEFSEIIPLGGTVLRDIQTYGPRLGPGRGRGRDSIGLLSLRSHCTQCSPGYSACAPAIYVARTHAQYEAVVIYFCFCFCALSPVCLMYIHPELSFVISTGIWDSSSFFYDFPWSAFWDSPVVLSGKPLMRFF